MSNFASDQTKALREALDARLAATADDEVIAASSSNDTEQQQQADRLRDALKALRSRKAVSTEALSSLLSTWQTDFSSPSPATGSEKEHEQQLEAFAFNAVIEVFSEIMQALMSQAAALQREMEYWSHIEESLMARSNYLLQSTPRQNHLATTKLLIQLSSTSIKSIRCSRYLCSTHKVTLTECSTSSILMGYHQTSSASTYPLGFFVSSPLPLVW